MPPELLSDPLTLVDPTELRILLDERIGGPGQYSDLEREPNKLYLPLAGDTCRIVLIFRGKTIASIEPGTAFDGAEWDAIREEAERSVLSGPTKFGREVSFSSFRVSGSWRGARSCLQILPAPEDAPRAPVEMAEHPFVLEFPVQGSAVARITEHRRVRAHRRLTLLLNVLLVGRTTAQPRRSNHFWAAIPHEERDGFDIQWVQQFYFARIGAAIADDASPLSAAKLDEIEPSQYYGQIGHDGRPLPVPTDLDESVCQYEALSVERQAKFDRAAYWLDMSSREWNVSISSSFAALVSAIETLTERGESHGFDCPVCAGQCQHEVPGATQRFKDFLETYARGSELGPRRAKMYALRSGILHGSDLIALDQDFFSRGWDPPWWNDFQLHRELSAATRVALRNWLRE